MAKTTYIRIINAPNISDDHLHYTYAHILEEEHLPFYIGLGTQVKKSRKYERALSISGRNKDWWEKVKNKKYYVIICTSSNDYKLIKDHEIDCILELGKVKEGGFLVNITDGGEGCKGYRHTQEHINKLKEIYKGENNPMFGKIVTLETRLRMSKSQKGRTHSEETKLKLSTKAKNRTYKGKVGKEHPKARKINQIDPLNNNIINTFDTIREAAKYIQSTDKAVGKACKQGFKVKKFYWNYVKKE
jgi:group I intron endonuclease